jgi:hypothetical protein
LTLLRGDAVARSVSHPLETRAGVSGSGIMGRCDVA